MARLGKSMELVGLSRVCRLLFVVALLFGCTDDDDSSGGGGGPLSLSLTSALPGEVMAVRHASIQSGSTVIIHYDDGYGFRLKVEETAWEAGTVNTFVPPLLDVHRGIAVKDSVTVSVEGVEGTVTLEIQELPGLGDLTPSDVHDALLTVALKNLKEAKTNLDGITDVDMTQSKTEADDAIAKIEARLGYLEGKEEVQMGRVDGLDATYDLDGLAFGARFSLAMVRGQEKHFLGTQTALTQKLSRQELETLIEKIQIEQAGGDPGSTRTYGVVGGMIGLAGDVEGAISIPARPSLPGPIGKGLAIVDVVVTLAEPYVAVETSLDGKILTASQLNQERVADEKFQAQAVSVGKAGYAIGGAVLTYFIPPAGLTLLAFGLAEVIATELSYVPPGDIRLHLPPKGQHFTEVRVFQPGNMKDPTLELEFVDVPEATHFHLAVSGFQNLGGTEFYNGALWTVSGASAVHRTRFKYGTENIGKINSARASDEMPALPAVDLNTMNAFSIQISADRENDGGTYSRQSSQTVKYVDGAVIFSFSVEPDTWNPGETVTIRGEITNKSSRPLSIYGLEFEVVPGDSANDPIYESSTPLVTVAKGDGVKAFQLENVALDISSQYYDKTHTPRLRVIQDNAGTDLSQLFWHDLTSIPADKFEIVKPN